MISMHGRSVGRQLRRCASAIFATFMLSSAQAALTVSVVDADRPALIGTVHHFKGTITNETGADLFASDLFFSFFNIFDPAHLSLVQVLGIPDVLIPDGETSAALDLFDADLGAGAQVGATYFADLVLQSGYGDASPVSTVRLYVIPEPSALALLLAALAAAAAARRRMTQEGTR